MYLLCMFVCIYIVCINLYVYFIAAGLESIDPNVDSSMSGNIVDFGLNQRDRGYNKYMTCFFRYWNPFGNTRETYTDKVTWFANRLSKGTISVSYYATAATGLVTATPAAESIELTKSNTNSTGLDPCLLCPYLCPCLCLGPYP